jgi:hypothetical protein
MLREACDSHRELMPYWLPSQMAWGQAVGLSPRRQLASFTPPEYRLRYGALRLSTLDIDKESRP